ncbi:MAG: PSD1 domain-containing protein [Acidobacteria bacterium]|nr:PSD1 domain-containing protein [Acidobacteriota bacterium]
MMRAWVLVSLATAWMAAAQDVPSVFERQVAPLLKRSCVPCHDEKTRTSGLSVLSIKELIAGGARHGAALVPGKPQESVLVRIVSGNLTPRMPFGKPPLAQEEIDLIARWITELKPEMAAKSERWWAFERPKAAAPPAVMQTGWVRNEIDSFVLARLEAAHLSPSAEAPRPMLLRRAYFDLLGVPPSIEEAKAFLNDATPGVYEKLVDRLLGDPRFGERWGRHWLDLARYADTQGFEADRENYHMWRYRDYVTGSFNQDKPYDRFIKEQIAGDEMPAAGVEARIATGLLRLTPRFQTTNIQELRQLTLDELTSTIGSVFLGLTMRCAQCHDHKYDPIPQKDFYRMQAFLTPMEMTEARAEFTDAAMKARVEAAYADTKRRLDEAQQRFDEYQREMLARLEAKGVKLPAGDTPVAVAAAAAADEAFGEGFVRRFTPRLLELERRISRAIANGVVPNTEDQTFTLEEKNKYLGLLSYVDGNRGGRDLGVLQREIRRYAPTAHVVRNVPNDPNRPLFPATFVRIMGDFGRPGEAVAPGFLSAITGNPNPATLPSDQFGNVRTWRTPLANWIASAENPLAARVMVNRIWQHLLGSPIAATPSDFGRNGARPTHPELLDWLAVRFVENKWSVKSMIRLIMMSGTYRQTSIRSPAAEQEKDPENHLLWKQNRRRLEGEAVRDSILEVSGRMNSERGGPGVFVRLPEAIRERMTIKNLPSWTPTDGPETRKRSIYIFQRRQLEVPFLSLLDAPVFQSSCERRAISTTAVQALTMMNDDFVAGEAGHFAERVVREAGPDPREQAGLAFRHALARPPKPEELDRALRLLGRDPQQGLKGLCRTLLNANEFVYVD